MIKLENVSVYSYLNHVIERAKFNDNSNYKFISDFFKRNQIRNYQELKDCLESSGLKTIDFEIYMILKSQINKIEKRIAAINQSEKRIELFSFDLYKSAGIDDETAALTDESNKGIILPHAFPFFKTQHQLKLSILNDLSIAQIKELISNVDDLGLKYCALTAKHLVGPGVAQLTMQLIDFYEQQIVRQALETGQRGINLFDLNRDAKIKIVEENIKKYVEYILENVTPSVWEKIRNPVKEELYRAVKSRRRKFDLQDPIKQALIDAIVNYTTLEELEVGITQEQEIPIVMGGTIIRKKEIPLRRIIG